MWGSEMSIQANQYRAVSYFRESRAYFWGPITSHLFYLNNEFKTGMLNEAQQALHDIFWSIFVSTLKKIQMHDLV